MSTLALFATILLYASISDVAPVTGAQPASASRRFDAPGLQFDYPSDFRIEHDPSPPETWKIDGDDVTLVVYRFDADDTRTTAAHVAEVFRLGHERCDAATATAEALSAIGRRLDGTQCDSPGATIDMHREAYLLIAPTARWMLSFMELRDHATNGNGELALIKHQISTTLRMSTP